MESELKIDNEILRKIVMVQAAENVSTIQRLFGYQPDWKILGEILLYLWKAQVVVEGRVYPIFEKLDPATGKIVLDIESYLIPDDVKKHVMESLEKETEIKEEETPLGYLLKLGLIERFIEDRVFVCPRCNSGKIRPKILCPSCKSNMVQPTRLVQHLLCGYTGPEAEFYLEKNSPVCPSCGTKITDVKNDLRSFGRIFFCENCKRVFKDPIIKLVCMNTETLVHPPNYEFDLLNTSSITLWKYKLTEEGKRLVNTGELIVNSIINHLSSLSDNIKIYREDDTRRLEWIPAELRALGFTIIIENPDNQKRVAIDYVSGDFVPYIMKSTIISTYDFNYVLIYASTPETDRDKLSTLTDVGENVKIIDIYEHSLSSVLEIIESTII